MTMLRRAMISVLTASTTLLPAAHAADGAAAASMDAAAKAGYSLGYQLGGDLKGANVKSDALARGFEDARNGVPAKLSDADRQAALTQLQQTVQQNRAKMQAEAAKQAAAAGSAYLAENAKKPGVTTTASGLQYKVVNPGAGKSPSAGDTVSVNYRGTLVTGQEFDSSYKRGEPAVFPVNGVIEGWTEALQLMKPGAKFQLVIPPKLAYGDQGPLADQVLLFDVELLEIKPAGAAK